MTMRAASGDPATPVQSEWISIAVGGSAMSAYLTRPADAEPRGIVLVGFEMSGLSPTSAQSPSASLGEWAGRSRRLWFRHSFIRLFEGTTPRGGVPT
jgi:hypothetical protein